MFFGENICRRQFELMPYIGGKCHVAPKLVHPQIPRNIKTYIEPFGGMGWSLLKLPLREFNQLEMVIYNDQNPLNVNLFLCTKKYHEFAQFIRDNIPTDGGNRDRFMEYKWELYSSEFSPRLDCNNPDFETAHKYIYIMNHTYNGVSPERASFCNREYRNSKFRTLHTKLTSERWQLNIDKLNVICQNDYKDVIKEFDGPDSFTYLDPPYLNKEHYYSFNSFNINSHIELANTLRAIKGRFALSYYYFPELEHWYPQTHFRWISKEFHRPSSGTRIKGVEYLIMNY